MSVPNVYADFNGLLQVVRKQGSVVWMPITGYGTLRSLARQGLRLSEGMSLILFESSDIQCQAVAHFDPLLKDPAGRMGAWVAILNEDEIEQSVLLEDLSSAHLCIMCGVPFGAGASTYTECCSNCGASVMAPLAPPPSEM